jgi:hypothetical protein
MSDTHHHNHHHLPAFLTQHQWLNQYPKIRVLAQFAYQLIFHAVLHRLFKAIKEGWKKGSVKTFFSIIFSAPEIKEVFHATPHVAFHMLPHEHSGNRLIDAFSEVSKQFFLANACALATHAIKRDTSLNYKSMFVNSIASVASHQAGHLQADVLTKIPVIAAISSYAWPVLATGIEMAVEHPLEHALSARLPSQAVTGFKTGVHRHC